jgi:peptide-methionine (S)-S-oxide reductase
MGSQTMVTHDTALPDRTTPMRVSGVHLVTGNTYVPPFPDDVATAQFAMGCFWGAERSFWQLPGVWSTAVGYAGGFTAHPSYEDVCSGRTGHTEMVLVVYRPAEISYGTLVQHFCETHNPTQGMRQGNDIGTQYRSVATYANDAERDLLTRTLDAFGVELKRAGYGPITTDVIASPTFYYAEEYHQQYLHRNPRGYCGLGGTGVRLC